MKRLIFTAIGIAAAAFVVKKLCYGKDYCSGENCEECGYCKEQAVEEAADVIEAETEENMTESAENGECGNKTDK